MNKHVFYATTLGGEWNRRRRFTNTL